MLKDRFLSELKALRQVSEGSWFPERLSFLNREQGAPLTGSPVGFQQAYQAVLQECTFVSTGLGLCNPVFLCAQAPFWDWCVLICPGPSQRPCPPHGVEFCLSCLCSPPRTQPGVPWPGAECAVSVVLIEATGSRQQTGLGWGIPASVNILGPHQSSLTTLPIQFLYALVGLGGSALSELVYQVLIGPWASLAAQMV